MWPIIDRTLNTNSRSEMFCKICVLEYFVKFTGKHLCWGIFLIKLQAFRSAALLKSDSDTNVSLWNMRNFQEHLFYRTLSMAASDTPLKLVSNEISLKIVIQCFLFELKNLYSSCAIQFFLFLIGTLFSKNLEIYCTPWDITPKLDMAGRTKWISKWRGQYWKVLFATMVGRQEKFLNSRRSRMTKTATFWPWWQSFNSFCFETLTFFFFYFFFFFATQKSGGPWPPWPPWPPRCRQPCMVKRYNFRHM